MRLTDYDDRENGKRVWLSEGEIQLLVEQTNADHQEMKAALLLMARSGLRRREVVDIKPADIVNNQTGHVVRVWEGEGDMYRETPASDDLVSLVIGMGREGDDPLVSVDPSTLYDWVQRAAQRCHMETNEEGWLYVAPHDLRRSWGVRLLEASVLPSVVMEWGGWEDFQSFRDHYLVEFSPEALQHEREKVSFLDGHGDDSGEYQGYSVVQTK